MKKILVIGSNGNAGRLIVTEALNKGFEVCGLGLSENKNPNISFIKRSLFDLTKEDVTKYDVVVDAFGAWTKDTIKLIGDAIIHLGKILDKTATRLIVVGGAGSLYLDDTMTKTVDQGDDFPEDWKPLSASHGRGLKFLKETKNLNWTYISPACQFEVNGEKTGEYTVSNEVLTLNKEGQSVISYSDYALALVEEIENNKHNKERISVVSK